MKYLFTVLFVGICFISCNSDENITDDSSNETLMREMNLNVMYPFSSPINRGEINFIFEYDNKNRLTKKNGGYLAIALATGFDSYFSDKVYKTLIYTDNKVTVENFYAGDDVTIQRNPIYYTLNSANQIEEKVDPKIIYMTAFKKQSYKYSNGKLIEIVTTFPNISYDPNDVEDYILTFSEKFYYDVNNNLIKTEYLELHNGVFNGEKIVRTFEDYDNSLNPFKRLQLLEEYFYRSLSQNNFRKYTETLDNFGTISTRKTSWTFPYDTKGNIIYYTKPVKE